MSQPTSRLQSLLCSFLLSIPLLGAACSDGSPSGTGSNVNPAADLGGGSPADLSMAPLPPNTSLVHLVSSTYSIPLGTETYQCQRITIDHDLYILKILPVAPEGVHHEVLAIDPGSDPDGVAHCGPLDTTWQPLFASGVGSPSLEMPPGVALKIPAGSKIVLDLHLFNAHPSGSIDGTAAIDIVAANSNDGYQIAAVPFVGPVQFKIPANATVSGSCTVSNATTFFAVSPHMHQFGRHITVAAGKTGAQTVVWDQDYNFNEQTFGVAPSWAVPSTVDLKKGDKISVTCKYDPSAVGVTSGESTTDEMCFAISYVTPAIKTAGNSAFCLF